MYTNLNPRTMGLEKYSFEELLDAACAVGFSALEAPAGAFYNDAAAAEAKKHMDEINMRFGLIMAPGDMYKMSDEEFDKNVILFGQWAHRAKIAGCDRAYNHIWPGSDTLPFRDNFEWHANRLYKIYHVLNEEGISYGLEYQGEKTLADSFKYPFISSLSETISLTKQVSDDIGFVFDTIHWYASGALTEDLEYAFDNPSKVVNLHLCDAVKGRTPYEQVFNEREMPSADENAIINCVSIVQGLGINGYDGPVIIEPMLPTTDKFRQMSLHDVANTAIEVLHDIMTAAGVAES